MADINVTLTIEDGLTASVQVGTCEQCEPGGANTQVQYNDGGDFAGDEALTWDNANHTQRVGSNIQDAELRVTGKAYVDQVNGVASGNVILDATQSNNWFLTIVGDCNINLTNTSAGMSGVIVLWNDAVGGHTVNLHPFTFIFELNGSDDYDDTALKLNFVTWYSDGINIYYTISNEA